jgi:hypothetical protein
MTYIEVFFFLQVLDYLTTLIGLRMGGSEMSPIVSWLIHITSPVAGLTAVKLLGFGFAGFAIWTHRTHLIHVVNYIFAGIVVWNLLNILRAIGVPT